MKICAPISCYMFMFIHTILNTNLIDTETNVIYSFLSFTVQLKQSGVIGQFGVTVPSAVVVDEGQGEENVKVEIHALADRLNTLTAILIHVLKVNRYT